MLPNRHKSATSARPARKQSRPRDPQAISRAPTPTSISTQKLKLRLNLKSALQNDKLPLASTYQFPLSAPPSDGTPVKEDEEEIVLPEAGGQGRRRGTRNRSRVQVPDMVFGSEMDDLIESSTTIAKMEEEEEVRMISSPSSLNSTRPSGYNEPGILQSSALVSAHDSSIISQDVCDILNTLQSTSKIQVDLPDQLVPGRAGAVPYTSTVLTQLYIQCYKLRLWHFCDLIADTWIRALQKANKRTHKSPDARDHMWRKNVALERMFAQKKKGFKNDVAEYDLHVQDPELERSATDFNAERLRELYAHTRLGCGARLLWADAMALGGRKTEHELATRPDLWPAELCFDVMCTSLRMVGRKLTLKIEEKYEGAWCRYHEHVKHGLPCYRQLAWTQKSDGEDEDDDVEEEQTGSEGRTSLKRVHEDAHNVDQPSAKHMHLDPSAAGEMIGYGDIDAEGESEEL